MNYQQIRVILPPSVSDWIIQQVLPQHFDGLHALPVFHPVPGVKDHLVTFVQAFEDLNLGAAATSGFNRNELGTAIAHDERGPVVPGPGVHRPSRCRDGKVRRTEPLELYRFPKR